MFRSKKIFKELKAESDVSDDCSPSSKKRKHRFARNYWTPDEDRKLQELIEAHGPRWSFIGEKIGLKSCKQVRDRYLNFLRPNINSGPFTAEEDNSLMYLFEKLGKKWKMIADNMTGRTEIQVKNRYYRHLKKTMPALELENEVIETNPVAADHIRKNYISTSFAEIQEATEIKAQDEENVQDGEEWMKLMGHNQENRVVVGVIDLEENSKEEETKSNSLEDVFYELNLEPKYFGLRNNNLKID